MPFERVGNKFIGPKGKELSKKQVLTFYAERGADKQRERSHKKKRKVEHIPRNHSDADSPS